MLQGADDIGRAATHGDADDDVASRHAKFFEVAAAFAGIVLGAFDGVAQGPVATGDHPDHHALRHAEGRWAFGRIQHAKAPAGAGTQIDQPRAGLESGDDAIHRLGNLGKFLLHGGRDLAVFAVHGRQDLRRRHQVDLQRRRVARFRDELVELCHQDASCHRALTQFETDARSQYSGCQINMEYCIPKFAHSVTGATRHRNSGLEERCPS